MWLWDAVYVAPENKLKLAFSSPVASVDPAKSVTLYGHESSDSVTQMLTLDSPLSYAIDSNRVVVNLIPGDASIIESWSDPWGLSVSIQSDMVVGGDTNSLVVELRSAPGSELTAALYIMTPPPGCWLDETFDDGLADWEIYDFPEHIIVQAGVVLSSVVVIVAATGRGRERGAGQQRHDGGRISHCLRTPCPSRK